METFNTFSDKRINCRLFLHDGWTCGIWVQFVVGESCGHPAHVAIHRGAADA